EAKQVANWICDVLDDINNEDTINAVREQVKALCANFPVYK
ncbi:MAG TPA: glycine hydroxymethyltransferase, partial [Idiomarina sp.]|nr:glycine hydroxymethyltransferase [Idiomarina sp.]